MTFHSFESFTSVKVYEYKRQTEKRDLMYLTVMAFSTGQTKNPLLNRLVYTNIWTLYLWYAIEISVTIPKLLLLTDFSVVLKIVICSSLCLQLFMATEE